MVEQTLDLPRSYIINTGEGTLRKNRRDLVKVSQQQQLPEHPVDDTPSSQVPATAPITPATPEMTPPEGVIPTRPTSRYGRVLRPNTRYDGFVK